MFCRKKEEGQRREYMTSSNSCAKAAFESRCLAKKRRRREHFAQNTKKVHSVFCNKLYMKSQ
jgi:hypothetical protein